MALADLIAQNSILPALKANSKKQVLQELAAKAAEVTGLSEREIFDVILQRERLGSTGVGNGVAIPHGKIEGLGQVVGVLNLAPGQLTEILGGGLSEWLEQNDGGTELQALEVVLNALDPVPAEDQLAF